MRPRQSLPKVFLRSGSIYLFKRDVLMKTNSLVGKKCFGMVLRGKETINIDSIDELSYLRSKYEKK